MTISADRARLAAALGETVQLAGDSYTVRPARPNTLTAHTIWVELESVTGGKIFGSLTPTWTINAVLSPKVTTSSAVTKLDTLTDWLTATLIGSGVAHLDTIDEYYTLVDNSTGASVPAVTLYVTTTSRIGES